MVEVISWYDKTSSRYRATITGSPNISYNEFGGKVITLNAKSGKELVKKIKKEMLKWIIS